MTQQSSSGLREELRLIEEEIAELRESAASLRRQVGDRSDGNLEPEEVGATIASAEELEAIVDTLETRRDDLTRRIAAS
jgi:SMC interacting uncharacterized protein involved in chromosome segregation